MYKYWTFEKREPQAKKTLADYPELAADGKPARYVVACDTISGLTVRCRVSKYATTCSSERVTGLNQMVATLYTVIQALDHLPPEPIPSCLQDLEEGRCVQFDGEETHFYWIYGGSVRVMYNEGERIYISQEADFLKTATNRISKVTDIYAVRKEIEV